MKQMIELSWWYHVEHIYSSLSSAVNGWIKAHPGVEILSVQTHADPTFFKGTLHKVLLMVETPEMIEDDFQTM